MSEGVDVYGKYNKITDFAKVRAAGIEFAYVKLSDGVTTREDYGYVNGFRTHNIAVGGYHYAQFGDPIAQANLIVDRCLAYGATDLAPALDLESPFVPDEHALSFSIDFLNQIEKRGYQPCFYANQSMMNSLREPILRAVPNTYIWLARYGANPTGAFDLHQYTSSGTVPGIIGSVDRNRGITPYNRMVENMAITAADADLIIQRLVTYGFLKEGMDPNGGDANYVRLYSTMAADPVKLLRDIKGEVEGLTLVTPEVDYDLLADKVVERLSALKFVPETA